MSLEEIQEIKDYLGELYALSEIIKDENRRKSTRAIAEERFIHVKKIIDTFSVLWLGELIKMVEGENGDNN